MVLWLAISEQKTKPLAQGWLCGAFQQLSGDCWGLYCLQCPCSEPQRQLPTASPGESETCVWVSLGRQGSHRHNPALVCHYGHFISSCWGRQLWASKGG